MNVSEPSHPNHVRARILYVITKANWGGAQRYVYDLAVAASEQGHEVTVACGGKGELIERLAHHSIPVIYVAGLGRDVAPIADLQATLQLRDVMLAMKPTIVHANSSKAGLLACVAARLSGVPCIIFSAHGWAFNESRPSWQIAIFAGFHLVTVWCADTIICVSEAVKRDAAWMPFVKNKLVVIHHGIVPHELLEKDLARAKLAPHMPSERLSAETLWIGTLAELHPTKGLDIAIRAFAARANQFPNIMLVLIGEGQDRNYLVALARQLQIFDRVYFAGHVSNASSLLTAFDIFLFPSRSEALGYALLEAGLARLPAIASNVGGIPEIIQNSYSGLLVSVNNVEGFTTGLTLLLEDSDRRRQLGDTLHEEVRTKFSKQQMLEKTLILYS